MKQVNLIIGDITKKMCKFIKGKRLGILSGIKKTN